MSQNLNIFFLENCLLEYICVVRALILYAEPFYRYPLHLQVLYLLSLKLCSTLPLSVEMF